MSRRTPEEVWRKLVVEAGEDAIERAACVSVVQAESDLAEAGFDLASERRVGVARLDALDRQST
jgi:hypothetical protein